MTSEARRERIVELLGGRGYMSIDELVAHFRVTPQTLRADLNRLADDGRVVRHHGGASMPSSVANTSYALRRSEFAREKALIGERLAAWMPDRVSMFMTLGTTVLAAAQALAAARQGLKVITNNLEAAQVLVAEPDTEVVLLGGQLQRRNLGTGGTGTLAAVAQYRVDLCLFSVGAVDAEGTLLDYHDSEVDLVRLMCLHARRRVLLVDHSKFGRNAAVRVGHIGDMSVIVTDQPLPAPMRRLLRGRSVEVLDGSPGRRGASI